jgi:hypothetical protein
VCGDGTGCGARAQVCARVRFARRPGCIQYKECTHVQYIHTTNCNSVCCGCNLRYVPVATRCVIGALYIHARTHEPGCTRTHRGGAPHHARVGQLPQLLSDTGRYRPWTRPRQCSPATSSKYVFAPPKILRKLRHYAHKRTRLQTRVGAFSIENAPRCIM